MKMTPEQCRSARELLGWQQSELAYDSGMSQTDISLFEAGKGRRAYGQQVEHRSARHRRNLVCQSRRRRRLNSLDSVLVIT
jgi:hypothetical protein